MTTEQPYTPDEQEIIAAWILGHSKDGWGGPVDIGGQPRERIAEIKRGLARIRRDAAREVLDELIADTEIDVRLGIEGGDHVRVHDAEAVIDAVSIYRITEYPEEDQE